VLEFVERLIIDPTGSVQTDELGASSLCGSDDDIEMADYACLRSSIVPPLFRLSRAHGGRWSGAMLSASR
jgi:hypothetical protein